MELTVMTATFVLPMDATMALVLILPLITFLATITALVPSPTFASTLFAKVLRLIVMTVIPALPMIVILLQDALIPPIILLVMTATLVLKMTFVPTVPVRQALL